jgi:CMP-N,N'-diacetyllegionaminic acid synthase
MSSLHKVFVFDLDGTLCTVVKDCDYSKAEPIQDRIDEVNKLHDEGHKIIIDTARGSETQINWSDLTFKQLDDWGVKYNEVHVGRKPAGDCYIDDKGINAGDFFNARI